MLGDTTAASDTANEALGLLSPLGDSWGLVHARGMLGAIAQAEHRFDDAAVELASAVAESERLGFLGQAALHLTRWGRVEQQRGDRDAAVSTLNHALAAARRSGDLRIAATAGTSLARLLRTAGDDVAAIALLEQADRWYRFAGGDGALVVRALLAAWTDAGDLGRVLVDARTAGGQEAELVVLDALARRAAGADEPMAAGRWLSEADRVHAGIGHLVDQADRTDAAWVRDRLTSNDNPVPPNPAGMGSVG
jgi:tetratricopeptide (TPR) repeat protein